MNKRGMTLVELLIAMTIGIIVLALVVFIYLHSLRSSGALGTEANIQQNIRKAMYNMSSELKRGRNAAIPNENELQVWLPLFQSGTECTAFSIGTATQTPVNCDASTPCSNACGAGYYKCNIPQDSTKGTCERKYEYKVVSTSGIPKLVAAELDAFGNTTGDAHTIANNIKTAEFEDSGTNSNLRSGEVLIRLSAQETSVYEKQDRTSTMQTIAHLRN